ncbi:hypothetical protein EPO56_00540, partial [Patescibacteria group bacterium]
ETQIRLLAKKENFSVVSVGESFRAFQKKGGNLNQAVARAYRVGSLEPMWLASYFMMEGFLKVSDKKGIIFDGAGRTLSEAKLFNDVANWCKRPYVVIYLRISNEEAMERQISRGRSDSNSLTKVHARLKEFEKHTTSACAFFKKNEKLITVQAEGSIQAIHEQIIRELHRIKKH